MNLEKMNLEKILAPLLQELTARVEAEATRTVMQSLLQRLAGDGWQVSVSYPTKIDPIIVATRNGIVKLFWVF